MVHYLSFKHAELIKELKAASQQSVVSVLIREHTLLHTVCSLLLVAESR